MKDRASRGNVSSPVPRYLMLQALLGCGIGLLNGVLIVAANAAGIGTLVAAATDPLATFAIVLAGSVMAILPLVLATAIGLLACGAEGGARGR